MSDPVDQSPFVKGFLVQQFPQIVGYLLLIFVICHVFFHVLEHLDHLDVGAAVLWTF